MKRINYLLTLVAVFLSQTIYPQSEGEANYAIAARYFSEVLNEGKIDLIDELFAKDFQFFNYDNSAKWSGTDRLKEIVKSFVTNGNKFEIIDHIANGENVYIMVRETIPWPDYAPRLIQKNQQP